jgi:hypothetical protein
MVKSQLKRSKQMPRNLGDNFLLLQERQATPHGVSKYDREPAESRTK